MVSGRPTVGMATILLSVIAIIIMAVSIAYTATINPGWIAPQKTSITSAILTESSSSTGPVASGNNTTVTETANNSSPDPTCAEYASVGGGPRSCYCQWAGTVKMVGFNTELRVAISPSPKLGQTICIYASVVMGEPAPPFMMFTITNSSGSIVYQTSCNSTGATVGSCSTVWDTKKSYQGSNATAGGYVLFLSTVSPLSQSMISGVSFTLGSPNLLFNSGTTPEGLQLRISSNSTSIKPHGAIAAKIQLANTLSRNVSISNIQQNQNVTKWNDSDYICGFDTGFGIFGFALFKGHITASNISSAGAPLVLHPPIYPPCAMIPGAHSVTFLPNGTSAIVTASGQPSPAIMELNATTTYCTGPGAGQVNCPISAGLVGYWNSSVAANGDMSLSSPELVYFPPGEYTIVALDAWNQYAFATLVVG